MHPNFLLAFRRQPFPQGRSEQLPAPGQGLRHRRAVWQDLADTFATVTGVGRRVPNPAGCFNSSTLGLPATARSALGHLLQTSALTVPVLGRIRPR